MKKILMTMVAAFAAVSMNAQYYVGGEIGFASSKAAVAGAETQTSFKIMPEFGYVKLVSITLQDCFPTFKTYYSNALNIRMLLKALKSMNNDGRAINMHKLFGDILPHSISSTACS